MVVTGVPDEAESFEFASVFGMAESGFGAEFQRLMRVEDDPESFSGFGDDPAARDGRGGPTGGEEKSSGSVMVPFSSDVVDESDSGFGGTEAAEVVGLAGEVVEAIMACGGFAA